MKTNLMIAALLAAASAPAYSQVRITEVVPWGSGTTNTPYMADWFELTNFGSGSLTITGWTMDDDSNNPNSALLSGITSIAAGQSVIFLELAAGGNAATLTSSFITTWFGASVPAGLQVGTYTQGVAGGVGLSTATDALNIFDGTAGTLQARVSFGASDSVVPLQSFDNAGGLNNAAISALSAGGVNGAFVAANDANEIGSPGVVPEPSTGVALAGGVAMLLAWRRRRCF